MLLALLSLALAASSVTANTEKVIFLGPEARPVPVDSPTLDDLGLPELSPRRWALRTHLDAAFPTEDAALGASSWVLLNGLKEGQRYEVRVCWAATVGPTFTIYIYPSLKYNSNTIDTNTKLHSLQEPTSFTLTTHDLSTVFSSPALIASLESFSTSQRPDPIALEESFPSPHISSFHSSDSTTQDLSTLFLHIQAAADYYTVNKTLMENVPPVFVDIFLDPFLLNVLPRSLVPTVMYILVLAAAAWVIARRVGKWIEGLRIEGDVEKEKGKGEVEGKKTK
jgi:hypothetical protein